MKNVRKVKSGGWIKYEKCWYRAKSDRIDAFVGKYVYIDDPMDGTLTLFTCAWLRKGGKQFVSMDRWICEAE